MDPDARDRLEREVRALCERADYATAATTALRGYGPELLGFLHAVHRSETEASDAFADLSEVLWRKLPDFAWEKRTRMQELSDTLPEEDRMLLVLRDDRKLE